MNNYCTNCGKRLGIGEIVCKRCHTPIVDIPDEEKWFLKNNKRYDIFRLLQIIFVIIVIILVVIDIFNI